VGADPAVAHDREPLAGAAPAEQPVGRVGDPVLVQPARHRRHRRDRD
jgi:hypothetical protein